MVSKYTRPIYLPYINKNATNVSILLAWLSAAGKEGGFVSCSPKYIIYKNKFFVISNGASCHGRVVRGASCPQGELSWEDLSPWGELSTG
jgi:hypothetical protein